MRDTVLVLLSIERRKLAMRKSLDRSKRRAKTRANRAGVIDLLQCRYDFVRPTVP